MAEFKLPDDLLAKFSKIDEKNRNWIFGGVLLLIFLGDYFLIMQPFQLKPLMDLNSQIAVLEKDLIQAKTDIQREEEYHQKVKRLRKKMAQVGNRILSIEEIPIIMENLSVLAQKNDVRINQIMPMRNALEEILENEEGRYYSLPIMINARAGYHDTGRFINDLENDELFMSITGLDIASNAENMRLHSIRMTVKSFVLERAQEEESGKKKKKK